jgi:hypothetical protein
MLAVLAVLVALVVYVVLIVGRISCEVNVGVVFAPTRLQDSS